MLVLCAQLCCLPLLLGADFTPPAEADRLAAIGPLDDLPAPLRRALDPRAFEPIPRPGPSDWLSGQEEAGQTYEQFARSRRNLPTATRRTLYFQPLGAFAPEKSPSVRELQTFAAAFFGLPVVVAEPLALKDGDFSPRINDATQKRQLLTTDILAFLKDRVPADAYCVIAITLEDLYPDPSWNFVFGQATLKGRVGVYSFARYDPEFGGGRRGPDHAQVLFERSAKVLAHETGHMFGMPHCIYFRCLMNGSNHLAESDAQPLRLCPVCLRKLERSCGFDVAERYRKLAELWQRVGLKEEARWTMAAKQWVDSGQGVPPPARRAEGEAGRAEGESGR